MSCTKPLLALILGKNSSTGKYVLKFLPQRVDYNFRYLEEKYGKDNLIRVPCGKCDSCKLTYRKNWSVRCKFEAKCHLQNCFVTLTYDNEHYMSNCANRKEDLQKFIHSVRDAGIPFRYFACGEYGSLSKRFHYHLIMFGYFPPDAKPLGKKAEGMYYESQFLSKKWNKGYVIVTEMSDGCSEYVAGYVNKKTSDLDKQNFILMSTRPGLGYNYFLSHREDMLKYGVLLGDKGSVYFLPKYANRFIEDYEEYDQIKDKRMIQLRVNENKLMQLHGFEHREMAIFSREKEAKDRLSRRRRYL